MLLLPWFWLWIAGVSYAGGHALLGRQAAARLAPELVAAAGLAGLSWGLALLSLGTGIGAAVQAGVSALAGLYAGWRWARAAPAARAQWGARLLAPVRGPGGGWMAALLLVFGGLMLVHAVRAPAFPDSALYNAQTVQWMQRSGTRWCRGWATCTDGWPSIRTCTCSRLFLAPARGPGTRPGSRRPAAFGLCWC